MYNHIAIAMTSQRGRMTFTPVKTGGIDSKTFIKTCLSGTLSRTYGREFLRKHSKLTKRTLKWRQMLSFWRLHGKGEPLSQIIFIYKRYFRHTETTQLICWTDQLTGFFMMRTLVVIGLV